MLSHDCVVDTQHIQDSNPDPSDPWAHVLSTVLCCHPITSLQSEATLLKYPI